MPRQKISKIITWNVNGLRACERGGFSAWFKDQAADVVCVQEIKACPEQLEAHVAQPERYHAYWNPAAKPGYSGVAIFARQEPEDVRSGIGDSEVDREGRVLVAEFADMIVINAYFPNSQRDHARLDFKLRFCDRFTQFVHAQRRKGKTLLICGDFNIAHREIDLKNPKSNIKNAGFLPEERAWMTHFLDRGYVDTFRHFNSDPGHYTWWSYRPGVRARNIGWRLDYFLCDRDSADRLKSVVHQTQVMGSDHCPVVLNIK
ncbi:MAG: exodeoxyribonuclease III [Bdellovibrionales bacterium]